MATVDHSGAVHGADGKFAGHLGGQPTAGLPGPEAMVSRPEADADFFNGDPDALCEILDQDARSKDVTVYAGRDEHLSPEQITYLLNGDHDELLESTEDDDYMHQRWDNIQRVSEETVREANDNGSISAQWEDLDDDTKETFYEHVADVATSDSYEQALTRNTPPQLMRNEIANLGGSVSPEASYAHTLDDSEEGQARHVERVKAVEKALEEAGMTPQPGREQETAEAVTELVDNGPATWHEGVRLEVITYGDPQDFAPPVTKSRQVELENPRVLLLDSTSGSGHDVQIPGTYRKTLSGRPDKPFVLDSQAPGYGWDESAGVYMPAYACPTTSTVVEPPESAE